MRYIKKNNKGQALIIVLLLGIVVLILVMSLTSNVTKNAQQNNENYNGQLAFTAAQSEAQNGINTINANNTSNPSNGNIPQPVPGTSPTNPTITKAESCNNVIPSASSSNTNCQYTMSDTTLQQKTTVKLAYGVMLPINLITSPTNNFSGTLYFNISGASGQLQVIYMTGSSGSETMTTCITSTNGSYSLSLTNASVVYFELLGSSGGTVNYSSSRKSLSVVVPRGTSYNTLGGCD